MTVSNPCPLVMPVLVCDCYTRVTPFAGCRKCICANIDYEPQGEQEVDLVKLDIKLNGDPVDALSTICLRYYAHSLTEVMF
jgi:translation elongation factor EF-4